MESFDWIIQRSFVHGYAASWWVIAKTLFTVASWRCSYRTCYVSILLGHQSVRVTEKHYNPWVRSRQEQLEADVRNAWKSDPLIIAGTKEVQIQSGRPN